MLTRRGSTLAELVVAIVMAGLVLGTATSSVLRQQRTAQRLSARGAVEEQLHGGNGFALAQLAMLSASAGDLVAGQVSDSALQLRATIAMGLSCGASIVAVTLRADPEPQLPSVGWAGPAHRGDTLWWFSDRDTLWHARAVQGTSTNATGCTGSRGVVLSLSGTDSVPASQPVRVTRPVRLSIYRAGDGTWQLGERELSETTGQLAGVQPVAGPFIRALPSGEHTGFRYFAVDGRELRPDVDTSLTSRIARVRFTVLAPRRDTAAAMPVSLAAVQRDSIDIAVRGLAGSPAAP